MADQFQLKAILSAVDKVSPVLKQMQITAKGTKKYLADLGNAAKGLSGKIGLPITALSGLLTGFGIGAIRKAMDGYAESGEEIYKGSLKAGLAVEQYQRLKYVFEQSGVSVESMEMSLGKLNKGIGMAAAGKGKDLLGLFGKLHISLRDKVTGELRNAGDMLPEVADAFSRNKNPVTQARMGFALFGKQWAEVVPMLVEGHDGIDQLTKRFGKLKGVMSTDDAKGAKDWGDLMADVAVVQKGFSNTIAKELVPVLSPLINDLILWAGANKKVVAGEVKSFVRDLVAGLRQFDWKGMVDGARALGSGLAWLVNSVGGVRNAVIGLAFYMNMGAIAAFFDLTGAAYRMVKALRPLWSWLYKIGWLLAANPWVAAISALALGAVYVYAHWDKVRAWFSSFFDWVGQKWDAFTGWIRDAVAAARSFLSLSGGGGGANAGHGTSGGWGNDAFVARPSLTMPSAPARVNGEIRVRFDDAPPGMRVVQTSSPSGVSLNPDVGYRTMGGPLGSGVF
jgi:hypothetical protein